jgi:hypothetical protein
MCHREHVTAEQIQAVVQRKPIAMTPLYHPTLDDTRAVAAAAIPVERSNAAILLISGQDDQMWPSARMATMGELYAYGGTVAGNAFAMADSWAQLLQFLRHCW